MSSCGSFVVCALYRVYTAQLRHGTARVRHGLFGPRLHCGNQRGAHGVMNRHVSSRAYSCLFGGCYATVMALYSCSSHSLSLSSSSQSSLKRRRQRMRLRFLRFKQRQSRKKALLLISLSVCLVFRLSPQPRSVWTIPR